MWNRRPSPLSSPLGALLLAFVLVLGCVGAADAVPAKRDPKAGASDCVVCHGSAKVLPAKHKSVKGMKLADCRKCHDPADPDSSLVGKLPLSHSHQLAGEGCASCHGKGKPAAVPTDTCTKCHEAEKLVAKTASVKPKNPHTSPHYGHELACDNCHVAHGKSVNFCNDCHEFAFKVP